MDSKKNCVYAGLLAVATLFPGCLHNYNRSGMVVWKQKQHDAVVGDFYRLELLTGNGQEVAVHKYVVVGSPEELRSLDSLGIWDKIEVNDRYAPASKDLEKLIFPDSIRKKDE